MQAGSLGDPENTYPPPRANSLGDARISQNTSSKSPRPPAHRLSRMSAPGHTAAAAVRAELAGLTGSPGLSRLSGGGDRAELP
eukprot:3497860-Pyramimonas_sp.AAC.1